MKNTAKEILITIITTTLVMSAKLLSEHIAKSLRTPK